MSNLQRFVARYADDNELVLEVDSTVLTVELASEINDFLSNAKWRLAAQAGNVVETAIRMFASAAFSYMQAEGGSEFDEWETERATAWGKGVIESQGEGWPAYESLGIRLVRAYVVSACYDEVSIDLVASGVA